MHDDDYVITQGEDGRRRRNIPNSTVSAIISGYKDVPSGEAAHASGALTVSFEVTPATRRRRELLNTDRTCVGQINHAVTAEGYTSSFVLVKNS